MAQTLTVTQEHLLGDLLRELQTVVHPGESPEALLKTTVEHLVAERKAARMQAACARAQDVLGGTFRPHEESMASMYQRLGLTPPPWRSAEEIEAESDAFFDALPPEKIAELEQLGLL